MISKAHLATPLPILDKALSVRKYRLVYCVSDTRVQNSNSCESSNFVVGSKRCPLFSMKCQITIVHVSAVPPSINGVPLKKKKEKKKPSVQLPTVI